jgi:hypothetical protein
MRATRYAADESDVDSVADDLVRLWSQNLTSMGGDAHGKLDWYYRSSPNGRGKAIVLRAHAEREAAIVGCQGIGFRRMRCGDRSLRAALLGDLAVDTQHRRLFATLELARRTHAVAEGAADFQYGFPNHLAIGLFQRLGYQTVGNMVRYVRVLRYSPYLASLVRPRALAAISGRVLDVGDAALGAVHRVRAATRYRLSYTTVPDGRWDILFEEASRAHRAIADRGRDFLRWRFFVRCPTSQLAVLLRRRDSALRGYAVLTPRGGTAHISDFLAASDPELEALLWLLAPSLRARGFSSVSVRFLGTKRVVRLLLRCRFRRRDADRGVVAAAADPSVVATITDTEGLYLTDADEDE